MQLETPYEPPGFYLGNAVGNGEVSEAELRADGKIRVGELLQRERFGRCWFVKLDASGELVYSLANGCDVYRLRYLCVETTEVWWIRRGMPRVLVARTDDTTVDVWKLVEICPDGSIRVDRVDPYSPSQPYDPSHDTHAGEGGPEAPPPAAPEAEGRWIRLPPRLRGPVAGPPEAPRLPRLWDSPEYREVTQAEVHSDGDERVETIRFWKLVRPVVIGPEPCVVHAKYRKMRQTRRYRDSGPPGLVPDPHLPMEPVDPEQTETVPFRIPGCEPAQAAPAEERR
jgi:hypothetical protein